MDTEEDDFLRPISSWAEMRDSISRKSLADLAVGRIDLINKIEMVLVKRLDGLQNFLKDVLV